MKPMTWVKWMALLVLVTAVSAPLEAQRRARRSLPSHYRLVQEKEDQEQTARAVLRNGLTMLVEERASLPVVAVVTYVALDSGLETPRRRFALDLCRRVARLADFEGRIRRAGGLYALRDDSGGAVFQTLVPGENLNEVLEAHRDLLTQAKALKAGSGPSPVSVRPAALSAARQRLSAMLYPAAAETAGSFSAAEVYERRFRPANVVLSVAGTALREDLLRKVVELYGGFPSAGKRAVWKPRAGVPSGTFGYAQVRAPVGHPVVLFGFRVPEPRHADAASLMVLRAALAEGRHSLTERLLVERGLAVDVQSAWRQTAAGAYLEFAVTAAPDQLDAAEVGFLAMLEALRSAGLNQYELNRAKALLAADAWRQRESLEERALLRARREVLGGSAALDQTPEALLAVTPEAAAAVFARYFGRKGVQLVEWLPEDFEERSFTAETLLQTLELLIPGQSDELAQLAASLQPNEKVEPLAPPAFQPRLPVGSLKRTSVLRGPEIYLKQEHRVPLVHLALLFPGGRIDESPQQRGLTELMLQSLAASAGETAGASFWRQVESHGCRGDVVNEEDFFGYRFSCLSFRTEHLVARLIPWLRELAFTDEAIEREKQRLEARLGSDPGSALEQAEYEIRRRLFGDHPYGSPRRGVAATVSQVGPKEVREWTERQMQGFHPVLLMVGDVDGTAFLSPLIGLLSDSKLSAKKGGENPPQPAANMVEVEMAGGRLLGVPGPVLGARDAWLVPLLGRLLEQWEGRIAAHDSAPEATGVRIFHRAFLQAGVVFAEQSPKDAGGLRGALHALPSAPIHERQHLDGLVVAITAHYSRQQDGRELLIELGRNLLGGEQPEFQDEYLTTLKGVQADELRELARRLFGSLPVPADGEKPEVAR